MRRIDRRKKSSLKHIAENCGACGEEFISTELIPVKLAGWKLKLCEICASKDPADDYRDVVNILDDVKKDK